MMCLSTAHYHTQRQRFVIRMKDIHQPQNGIRNGKQRQNIATNFKNRCCIKKQKNHVNFIIHCSGERIDFSELSQHCYLNEIIVLQPKTRKNARSLEFLKQELTKLLVGNQAATKGNLSLSF